MPNNRGVTTLKRKRRPKNPMSEYDKLPKDLRRWVAAAKLPWRAQSVKAAYGNALAQTGCRQAALNELDRIQNTLVAKDCARIWGKAHPDAS